MGSRRWPTVCSSMLRQIIILLPLLGLASSAPRPREPDHYFDRREFLGRGRSIALQLPMTLVTRTSDSDLLNEVDTDNSQFGVVQDISGIVQKKLTDFKFRAEEGGPPPPPPTLRPENRVRPLDYYYKFISVNVVDGTSRGGDAANLITSQCCHEVRIQG